jgi:crooked neck
VELELQLGEVDRCRAIYSKYLGYMPHNVSAWKALAQLETNCGEIARARGVYELAVSQPVLDMPELLWKGYIDLEIGEGERDKVRALYARLLERTSHVKVWLSFAQYEASEVQSLLEATQGLTIENNGEENIIAETAVRARGVFDKAYNTLKQQGKS